MPIFCTIRTGAPKREVMRLGNPLNLFDTLKKSAANNEQDSFKEPLHGGTEFDLLEQRPGRLHIKLSDDSDNWIPRSSADMI